MPVVPTQAAWNMPGRRTIPVRVLPKKKPYLNRKLAYRDMRRKGFRDRFIVRLPMWAVVQKASMRTLRDGHSICSAFRASRTWPLAFKNEGRVPLRGGPAVGKDYVP